MASSPTRRTCCRTSSRYGPAHTHVSHYVSPTRLLQERKYFDSGDYALSKAGKASDAGVTEVGREHPNPEKIPHMAAPPTPNGQNGNSQEMVGSPAKEGTSFLHRESSLNREASVSDDNDNDEPVK